MGTEVPMSISYKVNLFITSALIYQVTAMSNSVVFLLGKVIKIMI